MRTIQRQISLEPMTSRLPSIWPAYLNNNLYFFDNESLERRQWEYTSNWGMVPVNVAVSPIPYSSHTYVEYSVSEDCEFVLSFENLSKWYHFFTEYYNLLKKYGHCNRVYTSAEDYYNYESLTKYADQMIYGSNKNTYLELDKEFADKGGRVNVQVYDKNMHTYSSTTPSEAHDEFNGNNTTITDVYDVGFFKWICDNVVPSFTIPSDYRNYWKKDVLFYPDVIKWMKWFEDRIGIYDEENSNIAEFHVEENITELWNCKNSAVTDCCDCEEYFNRGGERMYSAMTDWYNVIQGNILSSITVSCSSPMINLPIELQLSIDDLGEFSIFSKDYNLGEDYRVSDYNSDANISGGTVTAIDGHSMYLSGDTCGYAFNQEYMEKYVSSCETCGYVGVFAERCPKCGSKSVVQSGWTSYTDRYVKAYSGDFCTDIRFYTYDENNVKYTSSSNTSSEAELDLAEQIAKIYPITRNDFGWFLIEGVLYPIEKSEFCYGDSRNSYLSGNTYLVFREEGTRTPYTFVNGKKIFAEFYPPKNKFYFPLFTKPNANFDGNSFNINNYQTFDRFETLSDNDTIYYVEYNGVIYNLGNNIPNKITINGNEYHYVYGYANTEDSVMLYVIKEYNISDGLSNNEYHSRGDYNTQLEGHTVGNDEMGNIVVYKVKYYYEGLYDVLEDYEIDGYNTPNVDVSNNVIKITPSTIEDLYRVDEITGKTVSKLNDIRLFNVLTDDVGNTIEGIYTSKASGTTNQQPPEGTELEPIFQVGNTANISRFSLTKDNIDDITDDTNYFVGDIITNMAFYYKDYNGYVVENTIYRVSISAETDERIISDNDGNIVEYTSGYTSLRAIQLATEAKNRKTTGDTTGTTSETTGTTGDTTGTTSETKFMYDDIFCDITYYVGATLSRQYGRPFNLAFDINQYYDYGVEYTETVKFVKNNWEYYMKKPKDKKKILPINRNKPCENSISYPIYVYVLEQDEQMVNESQYDSKYSVPMADFRFNINIFNSNGDTLSNKLDMETHNGMQVFPIFREEYRMGVSSMEKIDANIYIDRGINAAFEKHLKLGEVTSIEALEQYGNGFFKIMES